MAQRKTAPKRRRKPKGLGDAVENVTKATGIKKVVDLFSKATGIDCGCDARKEKLNTLFPFKRANCMTKTQYDTWTDFRKDRKTTLKAADQELVSKLHAELFNHRLYRPCNCSPKEWAGMVQEIEKLYATYEQEKGD